VLRLLIPQCNALVKGVSSGCRVPAVTTSTKHTHTQQVGSSSFLSPFPVAHKFHSSSRCSHGRPPIPLAVTPGHVTVAACFNWLEGTRCCKGPRGLKTGRMEGERLCASMRDIVEEIHQGGIKCYYRLLLGLVSCWPALGLRCGEL